MSISLAQALQIHASNANAAKMLCGDEWKPKDTKTLVFGVELELEYSRTRASPAQVEEFKQTPEGQAAWERLHRQYSWAVEPNRTQYVNEVFASQYTRTLTMKKVVDQVGLGWVIGKTDGSLENGIEFNSRPDTLYQHRKNWRKFFEGMSGYGLTAKKNCGLHIHVSRHNMSGDGIGQVAAMVTHPDYTKMVTELAGRSPNNYCKIIQKTKARYDSSKYEAINTSPARTFEWRIFAATTEWEEFELRLEFAASVVTWAKYNDIPQEEMWSAWERYAKWVARDNKESERFLSIGRWLAAHPYESRKPVAPKTKPNSPPQSGEVVGQCTDQNGVLYRSYAELANISFSLSPDTVSPVRGCNCLDCVDIRNRALRTNAPITRIGI